MDRIIFQIFICILKATTLLALTGGLCVLIPHMREKAGHSTKTGLISLTSIQRHFGDPPSTKNSKNRIQNPSATPKNQDPPH